MLNLVLTMANIVVSQRALKKEKSWEFIRVNYIRLYIQIGSLWPNSIYSLCWLCERVSCTRGSSHPVNGKFYGQAPFWYYCIVVWFCRLVARFVLQFYVGTRLQAWVFIIVTLRQGIFGCRLREVSYCYCHCSFRGIRKLKLRQMNNVSLDADDDDANVECKCLFGCGDCRGSYR